MENDEDKPETAIEQEKELVKSRKRKFEYYEFPKKCCVCGAIRPKYQMTLAPKQKKVLVEWSQVFGQDIFENCLNNQANHYICSIHWKQLRDDWEGPLPDVLVKLNNDESQTIMLLDRIHDGENVNINWKPRREIESNKKTEEKTSFFQNACIPKHMKALTKCCVCGEIHQKYQMTVAPKQKNILDKWAQVFGAEFLKTCRKDQAKHYICSIHWEQLRDDWEGPLPEVLEKMKKENNGSFEVVMYLNDIDKDKNGIEKEKMYTCRYCGAEKTGSNMTYVPTNEFQMMKWAKRLGQQFLENVRSFSVNSICLSHFKDRDSRSVHDLPMTDEMMMSEKKVENDGFEKCRFCYDVRVTEDMVLVPEDPKQLLPWVKKLGSVFLDNVAMNSTNYICWAHFNLPISEKPNYLKYLSSTKIKRIEVENFHQEQPDIGEDTEYQGEVLIEEEKKISPEMFIIEDEKKEEFRIDSEPQENIDTSPLEESIESPSSFINFHQLQSVDQQKFKKTKVCRFCEIPIDIKLMKPVTKNSDMLQKWANYLGPKFLHNVHSNVSNYICIRHFTQKISRVLMDEEDSEVQKKSNMSQKPVRSSQRTSKSYQLRAKQPNKYIQIKHCRYCNTPNDKAMMTPVTQNPDLLLKWAKFLGQEFLENVNNNISNYVCLSHLKYSPKSWIGDSEEKESEFELLQEDVKMEDVDEDSKNSHNNDEKSPVEGLKIKNCRYCNNPNDIKLMTPVTKNPALLLKWATYLGPKFLEDVKNNISNYICWSHFSRRASKEIGKIPFVLRA